MPTDRISVSIPVRGEWCLKYNVEEKNQEEIPTVSIPVRGEWCVKSSYLEPLHRAGLKYPNRHQSKKVENIYRNDLILSLENLTG